MGQVNFKTDYHVKYEAKHINSVVKNFIEVNHYKKTSRSLLPKHVYSLWNDELLIGVAIYGKPCGSNVERKYGAGTLELRRFCIINEAPRNSESYFLGATLRHLKKLNESNVISYADTNQGHEGVIYKASNFKYLGTEKYGTKYLKIKGKSKMVSSRNVYQKKPNGEYFKSAIEYQTLKNQGLAKFIITKPKYIYEYKIKG